MDLQELNTRPGIETVGLNTPRNALSFALHAFAPPRVTPQMLEGLRDTGTQPDLMNQTAAPTATENLTNEELAARALQPLLHRR
jgi:hypothetical protein